MSSHGSKICCPSCGTRHIVQVGEIGPQRQIEFKCSSCGAAISIAPDAADTVPVAGKSDKPAKFEIKRVV